MFVHAHPNSRPRTGDYYFHFVPTTKSLGIEIGDEEIILSLTCSMREEINDAYSIIKRPLTQPL